MVIEWYMVIMILNLQVLHFIFQLSLSYISLHRPTNSREKELYLLLYLLSFSQKTINLMHPSALKINRK